MPAPPANLPLPEGLRIYIDPDVRSFDDGRTLLNRVSGRLLRLRAEAPREMAALRAGRGSPAARMLGRRLLAAGMAHPTPEPAPSADAVTVVVPVRDRCVQLRRCLQALGPDVRVVVVDDASRAPAAIERVCADHGALYVGRPHNGGPAAARNTGLAAVTSPLVAFVDSDCLLDADTITGLAGHFDDPLVAAVAPRIVARTPTGSASALDLGDQAALVQPGGRVSYVPTATLLVRRSALADLGVTPFDEKLRYGEDVDLVWRLHDAGWWVRYDPALVVTHDEPTQRPALLRRRFLYGTSAGPLARRHPERLAPVRWSVPATAALALVLLRRPLPAFAVYVVTSCRLSRMLRRHALPPAEAPELMARAFFHGALALSSATNQLLPGLSFGLAVRRRDPALLLFGFAPVVLAWWQQRPSVHPMRWALTRLGDDAAYGGGVWFGAIRARTLRPVLPRRNRLFAPGRPD